MRRLLVPFLLAAIGAAIVARADDAPAPPPVAPAATKFRLGKLELVALRDAQFTAKNDGKIFGGDVGPAAVGEVLKAAGQRDDEFTLAISALVVKTGKHIVVLDTGIGAGAHGVLQKSLAEAGIARTAVTDVVITHSHFDHTGGLVDAAGGLEFPNATIHLATPEWAFMQEKGNGALVKAIAPKVKTFEPGKPLVPGVTPINLYGHTPGHVGYEISSGKARLLDIGDMAHSSVISLAKPGWKMGFDNDSALATDVRRATLARLAKVQELVFAPHFPYPGVGRIRASGDGFAWVPGVP
ncbi:MAG: MBL fold metallo-hydrolase [Proteobacteria bacterium]|nr:MBL fold metallo-hydrolase [Pseudomonadota bacterium]